MDSGRNCISNIRPEGLSPEAAAAQIIDVIAQAFAHGMTGVGLNDVRAVAPSAAPVITHGP